MAQDKIFQWNAIINGWNDTMQLLRSMPHTVNISKIQLSIAVENNEKQNFLATQ